VPIQYDRDERAYRIVGDFFLPPVHLTLTEALALSVLGSQVAGRGQVPFLDDAWRAVTKIRGQLPPAVRDEVAGLDDAVRIEAARVSPQDGCDRHFELLRRAIAGTRKVLCRYDDGKGGGDQPFLFRPYALFFGQRAWYVIGHSEKRDAERSFKLNRLVDATITDRPYMIPDGWTLDATLGQSWRMMKGDRVYPVVIRFDREFGRNVADTLWHPTQTVTRETGGSCLFHCSVDGLEEIVWWVLGYGPHAVVLEPPELRERVIELTAATQLCYQQEAEPESK
jgi:predicted DNA-binding transcriptional regulator YafY